MDSTEEPTGTRACVACDGEISSRAVKCPRCGTYQNWRRKLTFSSTVLSLLIALISVTGLVLPRIMDSFVEGARLHVELDQWHGSFPGSGGGKLGEYQRGLSEFEITGTLIISNSGDRSAHLHAVDLVLRITDGPSSLLIDGEAASLPFTKTIQGEVTKQMELAPGGIYFAEFRVFDVLRASYPMTDEEYKAGKWYPLDFTGTQIVVELVRHDLSREEISLPLDFGWKQ